MSLSKIVLLIVQNISTDSLVTTGLVRNSTGGYSNSRLQRETGIRDGGSSPSQSSSDSQTNADCIDYFTGNFKTGKQVDS